MIQALIFDMDGLIFDSERIVKRSWEIAGDILGYPELGSHIVNTLGFNANRRTQYFSEVYGSNFPNEAFILHTREAYYEIADREGVPMKEGALELLKYAKENGLKIGLATSSREAHAEKALKDAGIYRFFDEFVFGDQVEQAKPDPEIYQKASEYLKTPPCYCMALEDAPSGIRSAYGAGMRAVMVPDLVKPTEEIASLAYRVFDTLQDVILMLGEERSHGEI